MAITKIGTPELFDFSATNTALQLPTGDTASRPSAPSAGEWRFNTDEKYVEFWDGGAWRQIDTEALPTPDDFPSQNFNVNTYFGNGGTQTIDAKFNEAANFNGSSSKIQLPSDVSVATGNNDFTLSTWVYLDNIPSGNTSIITTQANYYFYIFVGSDGSVKTYNQTVQVNSAAGVITTGTWYNIVATLSSTTGKKVYVNGTSVASSSDTSNCGSLAGQNAHNAVGYYNSNGSTNQYYLDGKIDQIRMFNTALPATGTGSVAALYLETTTTAATLNFPAGAGCIAAYQLDGDASDVGGTYGGVTTDIGYTGLKFQPDLVWIKDRDTTGESNRLTDSVRGVEKALVSNGNFAELSESTGLTSFDSNGFTVGNNTAYNTSPNKYVAWCFKAGGAPTATNSNTSGSMTADSVSINGTLQAAYTPSSTIYPKKMSINTEIGLSIVQYQGTGSTATVEHGLGLVPKLILTKVTSVSGNSWACYTEATGIDKFLELNQSGSAGSYTGYWGSSSPTTSVFGVVNGNFNNNYSGQNIIAYSFADIANYQKIGSYTGNNGTNTISTEITSGDGGFEPAFLLIKNTAALSTNNWIMVDNKRSPANQRKQVLNANLADAETTETVNINFLTNGFQLTNGNSAVNDSSGTYIYLAIAADKDSSVPTQANSFSPTIYTGNGGTQNIYTPFTPDFTWIKNRNDTNGHAWFDSVRGAGRIISSNSTVASSGNSRDLLGSFNPNGFQVNRNYLTNTAYDTTNGSSSLTYVSWNWKAGGLPTINNDGTNITSIVTANQAAGFSIVKYKGIGSTASVGHGLGVVPKLIIAKCLDITSSWVVYSETTGINKFLELNDSAAAYTASGYWGSSAPTTSVFEVNNGNSNNNSTGNSIIAYCFADITGYQKVSTYNGTSGSVTVSDVGFQPRWIMIKRRDGAGDWELVDSVRGDGGFNTAKFLEAGNAGVEFTQGNYGVTFTSTGFTIPSGAANSLNVNGEVFIYLAIA